MRKRVSFKAIVTLAVLFLGCSPIYTEHDFDPGADFASYQTFSWIDMSDVLPQNARQADPSFQKRIQDDINKELAEKGLSKQDNDGDLLVIYYLNAQEMTATGGTVYGVSDLYAQSRVGGGDSTSTDLTQGMLTVDLVDGKTKNLVWRGSAENAMKEGITNKGVYDIVDKAIKKIFEKYPPE